MLISYVRLRVRWQRLGMGVVVSERGRVGQSFGMLRCKLKSVGHDRSGLPASRSCPEQ